MTKISIVIPTLNEAKHIKKLLHHLRLNAFNKDNIEITVVDGGSTDSTREIISAFEDVKLLSSEKGRAKQMNVGAQKASGEILYFLHADSFPPKHYDQHILSQIERGNEAGCFRLQFDSNHWWLKLASWLTQFSWRACRGGDQSQFITKKLFDDIGGFNEDYTIYEDNMLINELYKRKQFVVINEKIVTSARLYKKVGVWRLQYHFWTIYVKKWFGASPTELHRYYKDHIAS
ncbi:MAG: TIGR04283 family arsenosugar biosynthesis glycosyltransferase [bacterium]